MQIANGTADVTTYFVLRDSTNHAPKTDVTITDIDLYYCEQGAAMAAKVDATALAAADSAHADNKAFHVGQGLYRIDWPDEAFNGGVGKVANLIVVCTGVDTTFLEVELVGVAQTGDAYARLGAPAGASVSADIADLPTVTEFEARTIAAADYTVVSDLGTVQTGDSYAIVNHADYGNAKLVRSTTPANTLTVDATHYVAGISGTVHTLDDVIANMPQPYAFMPVQLMPYGVAADIQFFMSNTLGDEQITGLVFDGADGICGLIEPSGAIALATVTEYAIGYVAHLTAEQMQIANAFFVAMTTPLNLGRPFYVRLITYGDPASGMPALPSIAAGTPGGLPLSADANGYVKVAGTKNTLDALNDAPDVSADVGSIKGTTDKLDTALELDGAVYRLTADALEQAQAAATAALNAYDPPTNAEMVARTIAAADYFDPATDTVASVTTVGSVTGAVGSVTGNVGGNVTGSVGSVAAGGITAASIATGAIDADALAADAGAELADAVWDEALAGHAVAGSAGATLSAASAPTAADVADAVWDEALAGHAGAGSAGVTLAAAGAAGDPWLTDLPGAYADGTAGDIIGNLIYDIGAITPAVAISATQAASVSTGALAIRTHHTLSQAITSTTTSDLSAATKLWLAIKANRTDADAKAVVFIEATAGLTVLAGAPYITVAHGTLVVTGNAGAWTVTVGMDEIATGLLKDYAESMLWAECKALVAGATVAVWDGVCDVSHGLVVAVA